MMVPFRSPSDGSIWARKLTCSLFGFLFSRPTMESSCFYLCYLRQKKTRPCQKGFQLMILHHQSVKLKKGGETETTEHPTASDSDRPKPDQLLQACNLLINQSHQGLCAAQAQSSATSQLNGPQKPILIYPPGCEWFKFRLYLHHRKKRRGGVNALSNVVCIYYKM